MKKFQRITFALLALLATQLHAQPAPVAVPKSVAEIRARTAEAELQVKADQRKVLSLQAFARKQRDVIKLTCVNDKMVQIKAHSNLFDQSRVTLESVADTTDRDGAFHAMVEVVDRIGKLREEAEACVGQPELSSEFASAVDAPPITDDPTADLPFEDNFTVLEPPAYASPFN